MWCRDGLESLAASHVQNAFSVNRRRKGAGRRATFLDRARITLGQLEAMSCLEWACGAEELITDESGR